MKYLKNIIRKQNKFWFILLPLFFVGILSNLAFAQSVLPRMPSGPRPKAPINEMPVAAAPTIGEIAAAIRLYQARDYEGALSIAVVLAQKGDANAMALAGFLHERRLVLSAKIEKAVEYYRLGAIANNEDSLLGIGRLYSQTQSGIGISEARAALEKAHERGRPEAGIMLANILYFDETNHDKSRALSIYRKEAKTGNIEAAFLCALYLLELDVQTNTEKKEIGEFLELAAKGGIPQAQSLLGVFQYLGTGGVKNLEIAAKWFQIAAQNNDADGMFYWALVNAKGEGVPRDLGVAHQFATLAKDIEGENQESAQRLWQQLEQIRANQLAVNKANGTETVQNNVPNAKAAKKRRRR